MTTRAKKTGIKGQRGRALDIALNAPPVNGKANMALIALLADIFDLPRSRIAITKGNHSRDKTLHISGISKDRVIKILTE